MAGLLLRFIFQSAGCKRLNMLPPAHLSKLCKIGPLRPLARLQGLPALCKLLNLFGLFIILNTFIIFLDLATLARLC
jgi:hypothetical protein